MNSAVVGELSDERIARLIECCGMKNQAGVYHATNADGDLILDGKFARLLLTELQRLRSLTPAERVPDAVVERLAYLAKSETFTNPFGVEIKSHPEMGNIEWQEACAEFVEQYGTALVNELRRRTPSLADEAEAVEMKGLQLSPEKRALARAYDGSISHSEIRRKAPKKAGPLEAVAWRWTVHNASGHTLPWEYSNVKPSWLEEAVGFIVQPLYTSLTPAERVSGGVTEELCGRLDAYEHWCGQTNLGTDIYEHPEICAEAAALLRSQAEQIAALTKERDALEADVVAHRTTLLSNVAHMRARAEAAEAKLAALSSEQGK